VYWKNEVSIANENDFCDESNIENEDEIEAMVLNMRLKTIMFNPHMSMVMMLILVILRKIIITTCQLNVVFEGSMMIQDSLKKRYLCLEKQP
jgi:hypothetical protein